MQQRCFKVIKNYTVSSPRHLTAEGGAYGPKNICEPTTYAHINRPRRILTRDLFVVATLLVVFVF